MVDEDRIRSSVESYGIGVDDVEHITNSATQNVYKLSTESGVLYFKLVPQSKIDRYEILSQEIGAPETQIIEGELTATLMKPANGRLLAHFLPLFFAPGAWWRFSDGLESGFCNMGGYVARLHKKTGRGTDTLVKTEKIEKIQQYSDRFEAIDSLDTDMLKQLDADFSLTHGQLMPHNIYYSDSDVVLIDYELETEPRLMDIAMLEVAIEMMASRIPYARTTQAERLVSSFRRGYSKRLEINKKVLEILKLVQLCALLGYYENNKNPNEIHTRLTRLTDVRILRKKIPLQVNQCEEGF